MKKLIFVLVTFVTQSVFSQIIRIDVEEVISGYKIDSTTNILDVITTESGYETRFKHESYCAYEIDLTRKHLKYYNGTVLDYECDIEFANHGTAYLVKLLIDGYDIGMFIDMNVRAEQATWFSVEGDYKEIYKFSKFQIAKGS